MEILSHSNYKRETNDERIYANHWMLVDERGVLLKIFFFKFNE